MQRMEDNLNVKALQFQILDDSIKEIIKRSCKKLQYVPQLFCLLYVKDDQILERFYYLIAFSKAFVITSNHISM